MALFEFELFPVADIEPWGEPGHPTLSWFALTQGTFRMNVGEQQLFVYSREIQPIWGLPSPLVEHQVAALARDILEPFRAATTPLPKFFEDLVRDVNLLGKLRDTSAALAAEGSESYTAAWQWHDERLVYTGYLIQYPRVWFVRVGDQVRVRWDNSGRVAEGVPVWSATRGEFSLPLEHFAAECRNFADRLLSAMERRLAGIASGELRAGAPVDLVSLWEQHQVWRDEFSRYLEADADEGL